MAPKPSTSDNFWHPRWWPIWMGYGLARILLLLPYPILIKIGRGFGRLLHRFGGRRRHIVEVNIRLAFPEMSTEQQADLVKATFAANGIGFMESLMAWWGNHNDLLGRVKFEGLEHLLEAEKQGKGILMVGAHYSTLEMGGLLIGNQITLDTIYRRHDNPLMEHLISKGRLSFCNQLIERRDLRGVLRALRKNHCVWYAPDQDMGRETSVFVPFFGHQAATLTATSRLATLNHSPVIICAHHRDADDQGYTVRFTKPLEDFPSDDLEQDARRINQLLEEFISLHPEQYLWLHRRYKSQPDGRNKLYER